MLSLARRFVLSLALPVTAYALEPIRTDDIANSVANRANEQLAAQEDAEDLASAEAKRAKLLARLGLATVVVSAAVFVTYRNKKNAPKPV